MVDEGRHGVHRAGHHVLVRRGDDADAVGLHHAKGLENLSVGDVGNAEVAPDEGGEAGDSGLDAGVAAPAPFVDSLNLFVEQVSHQFSGFRRREGLGVRRIV